MTPLYFPLCSFRIALHLKGLYINVTNLFFLKNFRIGRTRIIKIKKKFKMQHVYPLAASNPVLFSY